MISHRQIGRLPLLLFVSLLALTCSSCHDAEKELKRKQNAALMVNNLHLGKNYLAVDPGFAVAYLITSSYEELEPFFGKIDTKTFLTEGKSPEVLIDTFKLGMEYYFAPFTTIPFPAEYSTGIKANPDTMTVSVKIMNAEDETVAKWDPLPIYPEKIEMEYQQLHIGSTIKIILDNEKLTPPGSYKLVASIKDRTSGKSATLEHAIELTQ